MKTYDVEINGVKTALQLSDADAKARGLLSEPAEDKPEAKSAPEKKAAAAPANKGGKQPSNKQAEAAAGAFGGGQAASDAGKSDDSTSPDAGDGDGLGAAEGTQA